MGLTKTDLFTDKQNQMAVIAKVLAHPARIAIIEFLIESRSCINSDLVQETGLAQATISQHLRELKEIGIIKGTIEGTSMNYCIDTEKWSTIAALFQAFFENIPQNSNSNCC